MACPGAVAERLGRGLQSLVQRFESARRLLSRVPTSPAGRGSTNAPETSPELVLELAELATPA